MKLNKFILASSALLAMSSSIYASDPPTYKVSSTISMDSKAGVKSLVANSADRKLYAGSVDGLEIINMDSGDRIAKISSGSISGIAIAQDLNKGFATNSGDGSVTIFDLRSGKELQKVSGLGTGSSEIYYEPKSKKVFISNQSNGSLIILSASSGENLGSIKLGSKLRGISGDTRGSIYIADEKENMLHVFDVNSQKHKGSIPTWPATKPTASIMDDKERRIYVATASGRMIVLDPDIGQMIGYVPIGIGDGGIAAQFGANRFVRLFIPTTDGALTVVQNPKLSVSVESKNESLGIQSSAVAVDPKTGKVFVSGKTGILALSK
jgi:DNA-binding beta-propeller fold protein YncE